MQKHKSPLVFAHGGALFVGELSLEIGGFLGGDSLLFPSLYLAFIEHHTRLFPR